MEPIKSIKVATQSPCPAFGGLRVLTRLEGFLPVLLGNHGCYYGLNFLAHFYAARKSIYAPLLNSIDFTDKNLQHNLMAALKQLIEEEKPEFVPVINLCVATTVGIDVDEMARQMPEIIPLRITGFGTRSHAEAKDVTLEGIFKKLKQNGDHKLREPKSIASIGEVFPSDSIAIEHLAEKLGLKYRAHVPSKDINDFRKALNVSTMACLHPFYTRSMRQFEEVGINHVTSAPVGAEGTYNWIKALAEKTDVDAQLAEKVAREERDAVQKILDGPLNLKGVKIVVAGYEGFEFSIARLLIEAGAKVTYVSTSIGKSPLCEPDITWLKEHGVQEIKFRKSAADDFVAIKKHQPDVSLAATDVAGMGKELGMVSVYFTNLIASRPMYLAHGAENVLELMHRLIATRPAVHNIRSFFQDFDMPRSLPVAEVDEHLCACCPGAKG
ncbi:nitrogenase component 1 [Heliophilum fasciatum]|uniref:Chlorophyllide a reductase subunit Y n=1 Tax=Heliophilum fasciatum TaxID=35700 RepID=A0A4R2RZ49_9FIRM|nr:nitrogenase component 1 [Heliophilum fasciatum]MCW2277095.1 chlorophyllide a reductase subunit Y [Heliophilum fasciatum]TCP68379.1 chlorophyllide a reductase subunit Y [Heliophilum fasciatum]